MDIFRKKSLLMVLCLLVVMVGSTGCGEVIVPMSSAAVGSASSSGSTGTGSVGTGGEDGAGGQGGQSAFDIAFLEAENCLPGTTQDPDFNPIPLVDGQPAEAVGIRIRCKAGAGEKCNPSLINVRVLPVEPDFSNVQGIGEIGDAVARIDGVPVDGWQAALSGWDDLMNFYSLPAGPAQFVPLAGKSSSPRLHMTAKTLGDLVKVTPSSCLTVMATAKSLSPFAVITMEIDTTNSGSAQMEQVGVGKPYQDSGTTDVSWGLPCADGISREMVLGLEVTDSSNGQVLYFAWPVVNIRRTNGTNPPPP